MHVILKILIMFLNGQVLEIQQENKLLLILNGVLLAKLAIEFHEDFDEDFL
jgi:hypothetical protein